VEASAWGEEETRIALGERKMVGPVDPLDKRERKKIAIPHP